MEYKNKIIKAIINTPSIVSAVDSTKSNSPDDLIWNNIFPTRTVPEVEDEMKTYITMELYAPSINSKLFKEVVVIFYIFTHIKLQRTSSGYVLTDYIQNEIDKLFNYSDQYGLGYLELKSVKPLMVSNKHFGSILTYQATNLNNIKPVK